MTGTILCFGEVLLRLAAPDRAHLFQEARLDAHFGGAEANVAVALARIGHAAAVATTLPIGPLGDAALETIRATGVDVSRVRRTNGRLGLYFLSPGHGARGAHVVYDRQDSCFALAQSSSYNWTSALEGVDWLHLSGIIPAIGPTMSQASLDAITAARAAGVKVSFDCNFRASMWARWCDDPKAILAEHVSSADLLFGNHRDMSLLLGTTYEGDTPEARRRCCEAAFAQFPLLETIASTSRTVLDADTHQLAARVDGRDDFFETDPVVVTQIVDRIGTGDAFVAGVMSALADGCTAAAERGIALAVLKHATVGDHSRATLADLATYTKMPTDVRR